MKLLKYSFGISVLTGCYFIDEIKTYSSSISTFFLAYIIQVFHDWVCVFFLLLFLYSFYYHNLSYILFLNILHSIIMILFCFYKRCVLTLLYNYLLDIPMCNRYIPIWQRVFNVLYDTQSCIHHDEYKMTYIWLNNHILQSSIVLLSNIKYFCTDQKRRWYKK
jgi:hypothetical protein